MNKKRRSNEERNLAKRRRYNEIKLDPEKYKEEKEKERQRYLIRKENKKLIPINEKSPRDQRLQRKKWREAAKKYREKKKENKNIVPLPETVSIIEHNEEINIKETIQNRALDPLRCNNQCNAKIRRIQYRERKKRLFLTKIIEDLRKKNHKLQMKINRWQKLKLSEPKSVTVKPKQSQATNKTQNRHVYDKAIRVVEEFYNDDTNSRICPGKREYVKNNELNKQKRYMTSTIQELYKKFRMQHPDIKIGFTFFCKYRPFWVLQPKKTRDTCSCTIHTNMDLITESLNKALIIDINNAEKILESLCCSKYREECLNRSCDICKNKKIDYNEFSNENTLNYYKWVREKKTLHSKKTNKDVLLTSKKCFSVKPIVAVQEFEQQLDLFFKHCYKVHVQHKRLKDLKESTNFNEAVAHIDFSENYCFQFNKEVQSLHFGGSRNALTLHTAVLYTFDFHVSKTVPISVCTVSECLKHDAGAVWAHIMPLIKLLYQDNPFVDTLHFISDSPTSQYRNKFIFFMISQLHVIFPQLVKITWNYLETSHGKGAPDGVGGTVKRSADLCVRQGQDIGNIKQFMQVLQPKLENIKLILVEEKDVEKYQRILPIHLSTVKDTASVHQVLWSKAHSTLTFRKTSCFLCAPGLICEHGQHVTIIKTLTGSQITPEVADNFVIPLAQCKANNNLESRVLSDVSNNQSVSGTIFRNKRASNIKILANKTLKLDYND